MAGEREPHGVALRVHKVRALDVPALLPPSTFPSLRSSCDRNGLSPCSGYIGLVRTGESSAAVIYDLMLPPPPPPRPPPGPPAPPAPPGACKGKITIHHTLGCFDVSSSHAGVGPVLPAYQPTVEGKADLQTCAAACYSARLPTAGIVDGKHCFCGNQAELGSAKSKALARPKSECSGVPCQADAHETECGGAGRLLAYAFTCDREEAQTMAAQTAVAQEKGGQQLFHNPSTSYSMRIDIV